MTKSKREEDTQGTSFIKTILSKLFASVGFSVCVFHFTMHQIINALDMLMLILQGIDVFLFKCLT